MGMSLSKLQEMAKDSEAWRAADHGVTKSQTQLRLGTAQRFRNGGIISNFEWNNSEYSHGNESLLSLFIRSVMSDSL